MCMPEPAASASGLGMNVACMPRSRASSLTAGLSVVTVSAATSAGSSGRSSSNWPLATSWWLDSIRMPIDSRLGDDLQLDLAGAAAAALEVAARVVGERADRSGREQEELDLGRDEVAEAGRLGLIEQRAQRPAAVARVGLAVGLDDLADEPRAGHAGRLDDRERRGVGPQVHVRLDLASQALDGRAVEPLAVDQDGLRCRRAGTATVLTAPVTSANWSSTCWTPASRTADRTRSTARRSDVARRLADPADPAEPAPWRGRGAVRPSPSRPAAVCVRFCVGMSSLPRGPGAPGAATSGHGR